MGVTSRGRLHSSRYGLHQGPARRVAITGAGGRGGLISTKAGMQKRGEEAAAGEEEDDQSSRAKC